MNTNSNDIIDLRISIAALLIIVSMGTVMWRIWDVMINEREKWTARLQGSSQLVVRMAAPRGNIRDRNGEILAENRANFKLDFYLPGIVDEYRRMNPGNVPIREYEAIEAGMPRKKNEPDIVRIVNDSVIPALNELDIARDYSSRELVRHYRQRLYVPYTYLQDVDFSVVAKISERALDVPGVDVALYPARDYRYGAFAAHILGYVGANQDVSKEADLREFHMAGYQADDVGLTNIERTMDHFLRGVPGRRILKRNARGAFEGEVEMVEPRQGHDVLLTIDARIQMIAEQAMRRVGRGAAVVVDPRSGDILAMVSVPSFDPNTFIPFIRPDDWRKLLEDPTDPLLNRALLPYAPGSTYKIPIALAGLLNGLGERTSFHCSGSVSYGSRPMRCWIAERGGAHGTLGLIEAIKRSCNTYFYQYGNAAQIESIRIIGEALGLGVSSGLGFEGEKAGVLPHPEWLAIHHPRERWSSGFTANTSIGQGYVEATPLQMAMVTATVASGGLSFYPRIIDRVVDQQGNLVFYEAPRLRADLRQLGLKEEQIEVVRRGMREVVYGAGGTASAARVSGTVVAGKTGTAQVWRVNENRVRVKDNHTWFIAFAPYDKPTLAVCVLVANGKSGGGVSAPIAARIIEESLAVERGFTPELARLEPAQGNFRAFDSISFSGSNLGEFAADEETADHTESYASTAALSNSEHVAVAQPSIAPEADEGGRVDRRKRGLLQNFLRPSRETSPEAPPRGEERPRRRGGLR